MTYFINSRSIKYQSKVDERLISFIFFMSSPPFPVILSATRPLPYNFTHLQESRLIYVENF